jgi:hypothetical protein
MGALTILLLPDGRGEEGAIRELNTFLRELPQGRPSEGRMTTLGLVTGFQKAHYAQAYPVGYEGRFLGVTADAILECIAETDWRHRVLVAYRSSTEDQWSYVTMGLSTPERLKC